MNNIKKKNFRNFKSFAGDVKLSRSHRLKKKWNMKIWWKKKRGLLKKILEIKGKSNIVFLGEKIENFNKEILEKVGIRIL